MNQKLSNNILLFLIGAITIFHLLILTKVIPYEYTWGGRLKNDKEMYVFEVASIAINLLFGFVIMLKAGYIKSGIPTKVVNIILWALLILFLLNTVGNLLAKTNFEKFFALLTLTFAYLIWQILRKKK